MRLRTAGFLAVFLAAGLAAAEQKKAAATTPAPPMDPKAAMEAMQKAASPGEAHKKLDATVGAFDAKVKMWMDPSHPPQESTGTSENTWVLGNRWVQSKYEGTFMGQPYSGIGYTGYDNAAKKYVGTWMDTASTGVMTFKGTMKGNVMNSTAWMSDPMSGKTIASTVKTTVIDNDHHTMEMWDTLPNGKKVKVMEIAYTRKK